MVLNDISTNPVQVAAGQGTCSSEISKIISAAVINTDFRESLLADPARAINDGYHGQMFYLTNEEKAWINSIKVSAISEFAKKILQGAPSLQGNM